MIKNKRYCTFQYSYREIFLKSALALSAPKTGCHHTSMSFSGPSKNPTLSISRIHATDSIRHTQLRISKNMKIEGESALKAPTRVTCEEKTLGRGRDCSFDHRFPKLFWVPQANAVTELVSFRFVNPSLLHERVNCSYYKLFITCINEILIDKATATVCPLC